MMNNLKRLVHGIISVITTFIFMAAPVATIVYSSESLEPSKTTFVRNLTDHRENAPPIKIELIQDNSLPPPKPPETPAKSAQEYQALPR